VRDVSVELDLGNRQRIIHGVHVQRRVLGDRRWDMRGLLAGLLQEPYWWRGVHCMRGGEDACLAGCYDGEHVPDVRGGEVLGHCGKLWLRQLWCRQVWGVVWAHRVHGLRIRNVHSFDGCEIFVGMSGVSDGLVRYCKPGRVHLLPDLCGE
jgi:hypothetical protein